MISACSVVFVVVVVVVVSCDIYVVGANRNCYGVAVRCG